MENMMIKNGLECLLEEKNARNGICNKMNTFCECYSEVDSVFDRHGKDVIKGFMDEGKTFESLQEACQNWEKDMVLKINTDKNKYTLGKMKPFNECQGKIFDVGAWKYVN